MRRSPIFALAMPVLLLAGGGVAWAAAATEAPAGPSLTIFFIQVALLVVAGRIGGEVMQRLGQPAVIGQLLAGIVLGPSVFGALWPHAQAAIFPDRADQHAMIEAVAQLGVLMLLLLTGMETDLRLVRRVGKPAVMVSLAGIAVPFVCGVGLGELAPDWVLPHPDMRLATSLFLGTALSIASVKIVAMVIRDLGFLRRDIGQVILASAILDDTLGWIIIGVISGLAVMGSFHLTSLIGELVGVAIFILASLTIGRRLVSFLIRWTNDHLVSEMPVISFILALMIAMALTTDWIGVHTVLGAFVAGVLIGESPILTEQIDEELRGLITALFMPVFFCLSGLSADLTVLANPTLALFTVGLILVASIGKFAGAFLGGWAGGLSVRERVALAAGMNARGSTEIIVATIGLSIGALDRNLYTMIVTMAVVTTLIMPTTLRWALKRLPMSEEEKERLEREAFEEKGFVANLKRLLLAVDSSDNGKLALHLAGIIAGARGLPTTVLHWLPVGPRRESEEQAASEKAGKTVEKAAEIARIAEADGIQSPDRADVTTRLPATTITEAVEKEAPKGYDLLVVGVDGSETDGQAISADVAQAAEVFEGPVALVHARGAHVEGEASDALRILVPVTGTGLARRAAEVAFSLARSTNGRVTALYVSAQPKGREGRQVLTRSFRHLLRSEEAILKDIVELGRQYGINVRTAVRTAISPDQAIIQHAHRGRVDLIVMGVNRRPGEVLSFGVVADSVREKSKRSILFLAE